MKPFFSKRVFGYVIDLIIISLLAALVTSFIPVSEKVKGLNENLNDIVNKVTEKEIDIKEYSKEINRINYELTKETVIDSLVTIVVYILYFVIFPVYNNGQTVGKKLLKLKISTTDNKKLTVNNMLFRELLLHSIAFNIIITILVMLLDKNSFALASNILSGIQMTVMILIIFMVILKKDGRGLHDIVGNTIVKNEEED